MPQLKIRHGSFCLVVACLLIHAAAKSSLFPGIQSNGEFQLITGLVLENRVESNGERSRGSSMEEAGVGRGESWARGLHNISHRVFQLADEKQTWPKLQFGWRTVSGVILGGLGAALSSAGGVGGGGLFVPLFNLLLQFDSKTSAALSNFMILGGSVANLFINVSQQHPRLPRRPLIDFDVVLLLQPNMLLGISTGVILNVVLPDWVITALLTLTLSCMTVHSFNGGVRRWKKETTQNCLRKNGENCVPYVDAPDFHHDQASWEEDCSSDEDIPPVTDSQVVIDKDDQENPKKSNKINSRPSQKGSENASEQALSQQLLLKERSKAYCMFPADKVLALAFTWFAFFAIQVLRGGNGNQGILGIPACGLEYWLLTSTQIPLAIGVTAWTIKRFYASQACSQCPESVQEDGFVLRPESCTLFAGMALMAGLLGGLLGIGGGMIVNPLLLTVGMIPQVTAATCASMVFFSSSMSVVQFWLMGRVPVEYAISAALVCSVFSGVGVTLVHRAIHKYNRASIIVFSLSIVMGVSALLMAGFGGVGVWRKYTSGAYMGFHYPC